MNVLSVKSLYFSYGEDFSAGADTDTIADVSFSVKKGERIALAGANGSGKSTLARLVCGFLTPRAGTVQILNGEPREPLFSQGRVPSGMVFQSPKDQLVANTVRRDTSFGPQNLHLCAAEIKIRTAECLELCGLLEKADCKTITLSSGQKQKLAFAGIYALHPALLVLDEALSMVDAESRAALLSFLDSYHRAGNTIVQAAHYPEEIIRCERVLFLERGRLAFDGPPEAFFTSHPFPSPSSVAAASGKGESVLELRNIDFSHGESPFFRDLNLAFEGGTLVALTGKSGSGKSTLMELACGLLDPCSGGVYGKSRPVVSLQESESALFEEFAADDASFALTSRGVTGEELVSKTKDSMEKAGLPFGEFADRRTFTLSGGEKRKLSLAGIIAADADIYFFDEPAAGLDGESSASILTLLRSLVRVGKTVIFSSHRAEEIACADRIITLKNGAVVSDTKPFLPDPGRILLAEQKPLDGIKTILTLQNAAAGSYCAKKSAVHSLTPLIKYVNLFIFAGCGIAFRNPVLLGCLIAVSFLYALAARYPVKQFAVNFLKILPWLAFFFVLQTLFFEASPADSVLFSFGGVKVTDGKIRFAFLTMLHYIAVLIPLSVFLFSTDEGEVLDGMQSLLFPLTFFKIPIHHAVLITGMLFRFVPLLSEEAALILKAQLVRNGGAATRGLFAKIRAMLPVFVPLILQTLKRAVSLSDALDARYYGAR